MWFTPKAYIRAALFVVLLPVCADAAGLDTWNWCQPQPTGNSLRSLAIGKGRLVAVSSDNGMILTTRDGASWEEIDVVPRDRYFTARTVRFLGDRFFLLGRERTETGGTTQALFVSFDGVSWTAVPTAAFDRSFMDDIAWGNGVFVGVGSRFDPGQMMTAFVSVDGLSWERVELPETRSMYEVAFGKGVFIALSAAGLRVSVDGRTWTAADVPGTDTLKAVAFVNGHFALIGEDIVLGTSRSNIFFSPDGAVWEKRSSVTGRQLTDIAYGGTRYLAVGLQGAALTSADGLSWTESSRKKDEIDFTAVTARKAIFIAAGAYGRIAWTRDGNGWHELSRGYYGAGFGDVLFGGDRYVLTGKTGDARTITAISQDGKTWQGRLQADSVGFSLGYGSGTWVAVGSTGRLHTSRDGLNWTAREAGTAHNLTAVHYAEGLFVAVGYGNDPATGTIVVSRNASEWFPIVLDAGAHLFSVAQGGGRWVAVGSSDDIKNVAYVSYNGRNWSRYLLPEDPLRPTGALMDVIYADGRFMAMGNFGDIHQSADGMNWSRTAKLTSFAGGLAYGKGVFTAVTRDVFGRPGIYTSVDGVDWTRRDTRKMNSVTYRGGTFLAVGNKSILQSDPF